MKKAKKKKQNKCLTIKNCQRDPDYFRACSNRKATNCIYFNSKNGGIK